MKTVIFNSGRNKSHIKPPLFNRLVIGGQMRLVYSPRKSLARLEYQRRIFLQRQKGRVENPFDGLPLLPQPEISSVI